MKTACEWTTNTSQVRQSMSSSPSSSLSSSRPCTLAVCAVIVDKMPTEGVWREWMDDDLVGGGDFKGDEREKKRLNVKVRSREALCNPRQKVPQT